MYEYVTKTDAAATLATIEEAYAKVIALGPHSQMPDHLVEDEQSAHARIDIS